MALKEPQELGVFSTPETLTRELQERSEPDEKVLLLAAGILLVGVAVLAQEEAEYQKYQNWMQAIRTTAGSLNENLESKSGDAVAADAKKLAEVFGEVHDFWHSKNISDAMKFAMDAQSGFTEAAQLASEARSRRLLRL